MRKGWLAIGVLLAAGVPVRAQDADAEALQRGFEKKLATAKAFTVKFRIESTRGANLRISGDLTVAGDKLRLTFDGRDGDKPMAGAFVSNGTDSAIKTVVDGKAEVKNSPVRPGLVEFVVAFSNRAGLFISVDSVTGPAPEFKAEHVRAMQFKLLDRQKLGDRQAQGVQYQLAVPGQRDVILCKVWFDVETGLPLKRVVEVSRNRTVELVVTETYAGWALEPRLAGNEFDLPK
jgi:hypothetical protein